MNRELIKKCKKEFDLKDYVVTPMGDIILYEDSSHIDEEDLTLWTLEEADADELVLFVDRYHDTFYSSRVFAINEDDRDHLKKAHVVIVPYIGQTPAELGLEK